MERLQNQLDKNAELRQALAVLTTEHNAFARAVHDRLDEIEKSSESDVRGLRRVLIGFSLSVAGAAIAFAITTLVVFGGPA